VNVSAPRLLISRDEAEALLGGQIDTGEVLLDRVTVAIGVADLIPLSGEISAWSARNEAVLARAFGPEAGHRYLLGTGAAVAVSGLGQRQAEMVRRIEARLRKLRSVFAALDVATDGPSTVAQPSDRHVIGGKKSSDIRQTEPGNAQIPLDAHEPGDSKQSEKRWWRVALTSPWTVAITAPLIVAMIIGGIHLATGKPPAGSSLILTGTVVCDSGRTVVAVWIAASSGAADSGLANLGTSVGASGQHPGSTATYTYLLRHGGRYSAHVGCGGTASRWASANYSPLITGTTAHLSCEDPVGKPLDGVPPAGRCSVDVG
jgi:hypothetical protein